MRVISTLIAITVLFISGIWVQESTSEINPDSLMGMWHFDHGKGGTVKDSSPNGNDGKIVDAERVEGKEGMGIEFDGSNHVVIPASETMDDFLDGFTYLLWVKPLGAPAGPTRSIDGKGLAQSKYSYRSNGFLWEFPIQRCHR